MPANPEVISLLETAGLRFQHGVRHDRWGLALAAPSPIVIATGALIATGTAVAAPAIALGLPFVVAGAGIGASGLSLWSRFRKGGPAIEFARDLRNREIDAAFAADDLFGAAQLFLAGRSLERGKARDQLATEFETRLAGALTDPAAAAALVQAILDHPQDGARVQRLVERAQRSANPRPLLPSQIPDEPEPLRELSGLARRAVDRQIKESGVASVVDHALDDLQRIPAPERQHLVLAVLEYARERGGHQRISERLKADFEAQQAGGATSWWQSLAPSARNSLKALYHGAEAQVIFDSIAAERAAVAPTHEPPGPARS